MAQALAHPSPEIAEPLYPGAVVGGRYVLEGMIARGGTGTVWAAEDLHPPAGSPREVALKIAASGSRDPALAERYRREAEIGRSLQGPHFVRYLDHGLHWGQSYVVMERLEGEDLAARLRRYGRMRVGECIAWLIELATALDEAHARGVVHRDLSPKNIFFAKDGDRECLKILDFGIAVANEHKDRGRLTEPNLIVGSIHYMAPEQLRKQPISPQTDIWAVGVILYRAIVGRRPFEGRGLAPLVSIIRDPAPPPSRAHPGLSTRLDAFFTRALCKEPEGRYASLEDLVLALEAAAVGASAPSLQAPKLPCLPATGLSSWKPTFRPAIRPSLVPTAAPPPATLREEAAPIAAIPRTPRWVFAAWLVVLAGAAALVLASMFFGR